MKQTISRWIESFKNWLNPRDPYHDQYVDDELYRGRRTVKRRKKSILVRRYITLIGGILLVLLVVGGAVWGFNRVSYSREVSSIQTQIDNIYTDNRHADVKSSVTQNSLDKIKTDISKLHNGKKTSKLSNQLSSAQSAFDVRSDYNKLFNSQTRVGLKVTTKKVDTQLSSVKSADLTSSFKNNYVKRLDSVRKIVETADKLGKRYDAIIKAHDNNQTIQVATIEALIKDMSKNQKSQKTVDEQTKLISLKTIVNKENKQAEQEAQAAAAAAEKAAAEKAAAEAAESSSKAASKSASKAASESAAAESSAEAAAEQSAAESAAAASSSSSDTSASYYGGNGGIGSSNNGNSGAGLYGGYNANGVNGGGTSTGSY
ncbi:hypothetical protein [Pediococcus stilesii]|uniref:MapZ extracellular domain-containing protein n=1 Tax=Pediococcus stilesii TaxID=331679 RepID=A0A0R2KUQ4_9LACO|nr:hypothetical protein [Pediococcus stilesii]KRN93214.1 hypothetical protein IV81_GL000892 [Pediococcus stilesii]